MLRDAVNRCHLVDLGFQGTQYTWTNYRKGIANIKERLDRAWCNMKSHYKFEATTVRHLAQVESDHHPILLTTTHRQKGPPYTWFRFLESWFLHPKFLKVVETFWNREPNNLGDQMERLRTELMEWSRRTFGNISLRKHRCRQRLLGIQRTLEHNPKRSLLKLER